MQKISQEWYEDSFQSHIYVYQHQGLVSNKSILRTVKYLSQPKQKEMSRLSKDLAVAQALENEDVLTDTLLYCKTFYGDKNRFEEFWDCRKEIIMEQAVSEQKCHNEHSYCSDSLSIAMYWRELGTKKCSTNAAIPSLSCLFHKFMPSHTRRDSSTYFT